MTLVTKLAGAKLAWAFVAGVLVAAIGLLWFDGSSPVSAQADTTAPTISSIAITSSSIAIYSDPDDGETWVKNRGVYGIGDSIEATVTFSEDAVVTGTPRLYLTIGYPSNRKPTEYQNSDGNGSTVVFSYTVAEGDSDTDGVSIEANRLTLMGGSIRDAAKNAADLSHDALADQEGHRVDGVRPRVARIYQTSNTYNSDGAYTIGDEIIVTVSWSEAILITGSPQLTLDFDGTLKQSTHVDSWLGRFSEYTVEEGDSAPNGVAIPANAISLNGGTITDRAGNDAVLTNDAVAANSDYEVDGVRPTIASITITSDPGDDDTYVAGDIVEVTATFDEDVVVWFGSGTTATGEHFTLKPYLELDIGGETGEAQYLRLNGPEIVFAYVVQSGAVDENGIAIGSNKFMDAQDPDGRYHAIRDASGGGITNVADLTHDALVDDANHKVDGRSGLNLSGDSWSEYPENGEDRVDLYYLVGGSDADITWSLSGDDSDDFSITKTPWGHGELAFRYPPNYENPTDTDANNRYRVTVEASDGTDTGTRQVIVTVTNAVFDSDEVPVIVGTARVGETLTVDLSNITYRDTYSDTTMYSTYLWERIDGDTATQVGEIKDSSYTLTTADVGKTIRLTLRVLAREYHLLVSEPTGVVVAEGETPDSGDRTNSLATGAPTISGTAQVGETLTADTSGIVDADGTSGVTFGYQWIRNDGTAATDIAGATGFTYALSADDLSKLVKVRVSFTDDGGNEESLTSRPRVVVAGSPNTPATGRPTIRGTAQVGEALTASTLGINDADGTIKVLPKYQWMRDDGMVETDIAEATDVSYRLISDDEGKTILLRVSFIDDGGYTETLLSRSTDEVLPKSNSQATGKPIINGLARVGETLTVDTSGISDADGMSGVTFSYQWGREESGPGWVHLEHIQGATGSSYTLVPDDEGMTIHVTVSFIDEAGHAESRSSDGTLPVASAGAQINSPVSGKPAISGTVQVGETLTVDASGISDADGINQATLAYQWVRNDGNTDGNIPGATSSTYTLVAEDEGKTIWVGVSLTDNANNDEFARSDPTEAVAARPNTDATGKPTISGTPQVGETLIVDTSGIADADGMVEVIFSYQWVRKEGTTNTDITGATGSTYTLVDADEGKTIWVRVSFTDDANNGEVVPSDPTEAVAARPSTDAAGKPTISGRTQVGEMLTVDTSGISDADGMSGVTFSYQWDREESGPGWVHLEHIQGAIGSSYTLVSDDEGKSIWVTVSFIDEAGMRSRGPARPQSRWRQPNRRNGPPGPTH